MDILEIIRCELSDRFSGIDIKLDWRADVGPNQYLEVSANRSECDRSMIIETINGQIIMSYTDRMSIPPFRHHKIIDPADPRAITQLFDYIARSLHIGPKF